MSVMKQRLPLLSTILSMSLFIIFPLTLEAQTKKYHQKHAKLRSFKKSSPSLENSLEGHQVADEQFPHTQSFPLRPQSPQSSCDRVENENACDQCKEDQLCFEDCMQRIEEEESLCLQEQEIPCDEEGACEKSSTIGGEEDKDDEYQERTLQDQAEDQDSSEGQEHQYH